jgi:hypothetical protein
MTFLLCVVIISNMNAELLLNERHIVAENTFVEMMVWILPFFLPGSQHIFKYRLALVLDGVYVLRYDNEAGKGDHKHNGMIEIPYKFTTPERLINDFWSDVDKWRF